MSNKKWIMTNITAVVSILILGILFIAFKLIIFEPTKKIISDETVIVKPKKQIDERPQ